MEGKHVQTALPVLSEKPKKLSSVVFRRTAVVMGIRSKAPNGGNCQNKKKFIEKFFTFLCRDFSQK